MREQSRKMKRPKTKETSANPVQKIKFKYSGN